MNSSVKPIVIADIDCPISIVELLNGNKDVYLENPWWRANTTKKQETNYFQRKATSNDKGIMYSTPCILFKNKKTSQFSNFYTLEWANEQFGMKDIFVRTPPEDSRKNIKNKIRIVVNPITNNGQLNQEDIILTRLSFLIAQAEEFMFLAIKLGYNININVKNDRELLNDFFTKLNVKYLLDKISDRYYDSFVNPPLWMPKVGKKGILKIVRTDEEKADGHCMSLFNLFSKEYKGKKNHEFNPIRDILQKNPDISKDFITVIKPSLSICPAFKQLKLSIRDSSSNENKDIIICDFKLMFYINFEHDSKRSDLFNPRFPKSMYCVKPGAKNKSKDLPYLTYSEFESLYGTNRGQSWTGHIFIKAQTELAYYQSGQPRDLWYVSGIMLSKKQTNNVKLDFSGYSDPMENIEEETPNDDVSPTDFANILGKVEQMDI